MADPTYYLDINGISRHLGTDYPYNERNYGLGISRETVKDNIVKLLTAGGYKNSFGSPSYYAGGGLARRYGKDNYLDLGVIGGVATGYDKKVSPMAAVMASIGRKNFARLNAMYAPKTEKNPSMIMMNLGIPFK